MSDASLLSYFSTKLPIPGVLCNANHRVKSRGAVERVPMPSKESETPKDGKQKEMKFLLAWGLGVRGGTPRR
jgi:hypothetical protein